LPRIAKFIRHEKLKMLKKKNTRQLYVSKGRTALMIFLTGGIYQREEPAALGRRQ
jgi:hypothetical protein